MSDLFTLFTHNKSKEEVCLWLNLTFGNDLPFSEYEIVGLYITPVYYLYSEILYIKD